jgi:type IX secretion system PorP/SprF family membrane protein
MIKYHLRLLIPALLISFTAYGQETGAGLNYQITMISNPAVTGSEGDGILRLSYQIHYPGNSFNLNTVFLSYDGFFTALHGGAGFFLSDNCLGGIINDLKGGVSYSYYFQASENLFISAGLSASFYHRGYNFGVAVLPDQIDPVGGVAFPSGEVLSSKGRTIFDIGTGFMFMAGRVFGGLSVSHLAEPDLIDNDYAEARLKRQILLHIAGDFDLSRKKMLKIRPLGKLEVRKEFLSAGAGAVLESNYMSVSSILLADNAKNIDIQTGFSVKAGRLIVFYNYRFNIVSGNNVLPFTLLHHTGIAFSLNNVDKRKTIKTINFPKL